MRRIETLFIAFAMHFPPLPKAATSEFKHIKGNETLEKSDLLLSRPSWNQTGTDCFIQEYLSSRAQRGSFSSIFFVAVAQAKQRLLLGEKVEKHFQQPRKNAGDQDDDDT